MKSRIQEKFMGIIVSCSIVEQFQVLLFNEIMKSPGVQSPAWQP